MSGWFALMLAVQVVTIDPDAAGVTVVPAEQPLCTLTGDCDGPSPREPWPTMERVGRADMRYIPPAGLPAPPSDPPPEVTFAFARLQDRLEPPARVLCQEIARRLNDSNLEAVEISLEGHAAIQRDRLAAIQLSERRANRVRECLIERGVDAKRLMSVAYGFERPLTAEGTGKEEDVVKLVIFDR